VPDLGDFSDFEAAADLAEQVEPDTFTIYGQQFTVAEQVSGIPLMRLAKVAATSDQILKHGTPEEIAAAEMTGLGAMYDFLEQVLIPGDFDRFCHVATAHRMSDEALYKIGQHLYGVISSRPTTRQSNSSSGQPPTSPDSKPTSSALAAAGEQVTAEEALRLLQPAT
jgi:hypothetical protein